MSRDETITLLKQLCDERADLLAKAQNAAAPFTVEAMARQAKIEALAKTLVEVPDEGSASLNVADIYTIKVSRTATRKADTHGLMSNWDKLPEKVQGAFKFEASVKLKELRALAGADAEAAATYYSTSISDPKISIEVRK